MLYVRTSCSVIKLQTVAVHDKCIVEHVSTSLAPLPTWICLSDTSSPSVAMDSSFSPPLLSMCDLSPSYVGVGELFDHGLDSWAAILLPLSIYSGIGIGKPWGTNAAEGYPALLCKEGEREKEEEEGGEGERREARC